MNDDASTRTLYLLRHAQAMHAVPGNDDRERALTPGGRRTVLALNEQLIGEEANPGLVRCSPARRARETLENLSWAAAAEVLVDERLYAGSVETLFGVIAETHPAHVSLLLIGHNPALSELASALLDPAAAGVLPAGLGTSTLAALSVHEPWDRVAAGDCSLQAVHNGR